MPERRTRAAAAKDTAPGPHPRNRHQGRYDLRRLAAASPELAPFIVRGPVGGETVDFADPLAVLALNRAILRHDYGVAWWQIPPGFLCPPIPGRADYLHHAADLLAAGNDGAVPRGAGVRALDIGVGANCIYPLLGHREYGWSFVGTDTAADALASAERIVRENGLGSAIALRRQTARDRIFTGIVAKDERFDLTICNPPFHASLDDAHEGSRRKWRNLGKSDGRTGAPALNFGGQEAELWCPGGEAGFVRRMIDESARIARSCRWFTTLVSQESNLPPIMAALTAARATETRTIPMAQGQKRSRIVAWTFLDRMQRDMWRQVRWEAAAP